MAFPATYKAMVEADYTRSCYAVCSACRAAMEWWRTPKGGRIPMDPMPLDDSPAVSHFATCPNAEQFRKRPEKVTKLETPSLFDGGLE